MEELISTDAAEDVEEDVDAGQPKVSARHTEADATATLTEITRTQEENARRAQKGTRKRLPSQT